MFDAVTYITYLVLLSGVMFLLVYRRYVTHVDGNFSYDGFDISKNKIDFSALITLLLISFVVGFRYNVGVDWEGYKEEFELLRINPGITFRDQRFEWGYFMINKFIAHIGGQYTFMFFIVALISWFFIFKSINSILLPYVIFFSFTTGIFFWSMNGVRQFVAFSVFLYSIKFIISRNLGIYLLLIVLASLFHRSAIFLMPIYFFPFRSMYNRNFWLISFIITALAGNVAQITDGVESLAMFVFQKFSIFSSYNFYLENELFVSNDTNIGLGFYFAQIITIIEIFLSKAILSKHPHLKVYFILYFIGAILFNLFYSVQLMGRALVYLMLLRAVIISIVTYYCILNRHLRAFGIVLIVLFFWLFLYEIYTSSNMCSPYSFSFFREF